MRIIGACLQYRHTYEQNLILEVSTAQLSIDCWRVKSMFQPAS